MGESDGRCEEQKRGKFDSLRCCLPAGHSEPCNFVVMGVLPAQDKPGPPRKRSDAEYAKYRKWYTQKTAIRSGA